ncbi:MAG: PTS sugar transporter subunit IIA [Planctomycetota bacterium]|jgi:fructose-specific phosphotransferase system IIA component
MNLKQILLPQCVAVPLQSKEKEAAISELVDLLDKKELLQKKQDVLDAVLMREKTRSTGIGSSVAIPHGKCKAVKELVMAVGVTAEPIDFASVDGKPVKIIILLVSPLDQTGPHIQALASISRLMLDEQFKQSFENAESAEQLYELIISRDND